MATQQIHVDVGTHRVTASSSVTVAGGSGVLHGRDVHAGNVGVVGAGLTYADLAPIGDTHLRTSWLSANADGDRVWHGPCPENVDPHWHFERFDVAGRISVSLDLMHVMRCRVRTDGPYPLRFLGSGTFDGDFVGAIFDDVEVHGPPSERFGSILAGQRPNSALVRRCHFRNHAIGAQLQTGNSYVNCLVEDIHYFDGSHNTCVSTRGGQVGIQVVGCNLDGGNSAALGAYTDLGPVTDLLVRDCLLNPDRANYGIIAEDDVGNHDVRFTGNVFGRRYWRNCGQSGPYSGWNGSRPGNVWEGNTWGPRGPHWQPGDPEEGDPVG